MSDLPRPEVQMVYWVPTSVLPPGDPEAQRPVVVVTAPETASGTLAVVARSTTDNFGPEHPAGGHLGFSSPGRFSRRHPVQAQLWTSARVTLAGRLDDATFAAVVRRFGR